MKVQVVEDNGQVVGTIEDADLCLVSSKSEALMFAEIREMIYRAVRCLPPRKSLAADR